MFILVLMCSMFHGGEMIARQDSRNHWVRTDDRDFCWADCVRQDRFMDWAGSEDAKDSEDHVAKSVQTYADAKHCELLADQLQAQAVQDLLGFADINWDVAAHEDAATWDEYFAAVADQESKEAAIQQQNVERAVIKFAAKKQADEVEANRKAVGEVPVVRARTPHPSVGYLEPVSPPKVAPVCVYCSKAL